MTQATNDPQAEFDAIGTMIADAIRAYGEPRTSFESDHIERLERIRTRAWRMASRMEEERLRHPY